jgi:AAA domain/Winged helix-turn-helix DNA-binding
MSADIARLEVFARRVVEEDDSAFRSDPVSYWDDQIAKPLPDADLPFLVPEDRGTAELSAVGEREYAEDLLRPGRIHVVAAEEGTGKSYAMTELGIRVAAGGGSFADTWPVLERGPVLVLSEMHPDDGYEREATVLASLGLDREALRGCYFRLPVMTAADSEPALQSDRWLAWIARWLEPKGVRLLVIDTATGAAQVDPWGRDIQAVFRRLRGLLEDCPELAVVLLVHLKKARFEGQRRISDVLGEWGRWCDVVLLMEHDGTRTKLSTRKRVRHERRIAVTKRGGLLVDPIDLEEVQGAKVPTQDVLAAIDAEPGIGVRELAARIGVSKDTANRYVKSLGTAVDALPTGPKGGLRFYLTAAPPQTTAGTEYGSDAVDVTTLDGSDRRTAARTSIGAAVPAAVVVKDESVEDGGYPPSAWQREDGV